MHVSTSANQPCRFVSRIVEHLNMQLVVRPVQRRHRIEQPLDNIPLVVDRQLDGDIRKLGEWLQDDLVLPVNQVQQAYGDGIESIQ